MSTKDKKKNVAERNEDAVRVVRWFFVVAVFGLFPSILHAFANRYITGFNDCNYLIGLLFLGFTMCSSTFDDLAARPAKSKFIQDGNEIEFTPWQYTLFYYLLLSLSILTPLIYGFNAVLLALGGSFEIGSQKFELDVSGYIALSIVSFGVILLFTLILQIFLINKKWE